MQEVPLGQFKGFGPLGEFAAGDAPRLFGTVISSIIGFLTIVAGLWFFFQIIIGGLGWLSAGGDKAKVEEARTKITNAVVGLFVVVIAIFLVRLISSLLGIEDILDPVEAIKRLTPGIGNIEKGPAVPKVK